MPLTQMPMGMLFISAGSGIQLYGSETRPSNTANARSGTGRDHELVPPTSHPCNVLPRIYLNIVYSPSSFSLFQETLPHQNFVRTPCHFPFHA